VCLCGRLAYLQTSIQQFWMTFCSTWQRGCLICCMLISECDSIYRAAVVASFFGMNLPRYKSSVQVSLWSSIQTLHGGAVDYPTDSQKENYCWLHVVHVKLQTSKVASDYWSLKEGNWGQWVWTASKSFLVGCGRSDSHIIESKCWTSIYLSCMAQNCRSAACPGVSLSYLFWKIYHNGYLLIASMM
jgi:hypothetical protein